MQLPGADGTLREMQGGTMVRREIWMWAFVAVSFGMWNPPAYGTTLETELSRDSLESSRAALWGGTSGALRENSVPFLVLLPPEARSVENLEIFWQCDGPCTTSLSLQHLNEGTGRLRNLTTGKPAASLALRESASGLIRFPIGREGDVVLLPLLAMVPENVVSGRLRIEFDNEASPRLFHRVPGGLSRLAINADALTRWYRPRVFRDDLPRTVIVTRQQFADTSEELVDFVAQKESMGFRPHLVVFEDILGQCTLEPDAMAYRQYCLRNWLKARYEEWPLEYLIILGGPDTADDAAIPMLTCHPARDYEDGPGDAPTDFFYADLTGDWNPDGDYFPCELEDYMHVSEDGTLTSRDDGVDLVPELVVGRIPHQGTLPFYGDSVLRRLVTYHATPPDRWHNKALMPTPQVTFPDGSWVDTSLIASYIEEQTFSEHAVTSVRLSEAEGKLPSIVQAPVDLDWQNLIDTWELGQSVVFWCAHGSSEGAFRDVWFNDANGDGLPQQMEVEEPPFINKKLTKMELSDDFPPVVFQGSCLNAEPEDHGNLAHTILRNFSVANIASTRITMGLSPGGDENWRPSPITPGAFTLGVYFLHRLMGAREPVGHAFQQATSALTFGVQPSTFKVRLEFNLYGDPTVTIPGCAQDSHCVDESVCNGTERCEQGRCVPGDFLHCEVDPADLAECRVSVCEPTDGCTTGPADDYEMCDDQDHCTEGDYCWQGDCVASEKQCYRPNPYCYESWCEAGTGECQLKMLENGTLCSLDSRDGECLDGYCVVAMENINPGDAKAGDASSDSDDGISGAGGETEAHTSASGCSHNSGRDLPCPAGPFLFVLALLALLALLCRVPVRN